MRYTCTYTLYTLHNSSLEKRINLIRCLCRFIYEQYFLLTNKSNLAGLVKHREQPVTKLGGTTRRFCSIFPNCFPCRLYPLIVILETCGVSPKNNSFFVVEGNITNLSRSSFKLIFPPVVCYSSSSMPSSLLIIDCNL